MSDIKLYEFAGSDWVVARNLREAVRCWISYSDATIREALEDFREVPRSQWYRYTFRYDEAGERTAKFDVRIKEIIKTKEESVPFFLASSEY